jgi:hypothetical protein
MAVGGDVGSADTYSGRVGGVYIFNLIVGAGT